MHASREDEKPDLSGSLGVVRSSAKAETEKTSARASAKRESMSFTATVSTSRPRDLRETPPNPDNAIAAAPPPQCLGFAEEAASGSLSRFGLLSSMQAEKMFEIIRAERDGRPA